MAPPIKKLKTRHGDAQSIVGACVQDSPVIRLVVGPTREVVEVHLKLACHFSSYFKNMFAGSGSYVETKSKEIVWHDEQIAIVKIFASWLYTQRLTVNGVTVENDTMPTYATDTDLIGIAEKENDFNDNDDFHDTLHVGQSSKTHFPNSEIPLLLKIWVFGDKRGIPILCNDVLSDLYFRIFGNDEVLKWSNVLSAWASCSPTSKLATFLVDVITTGNDLSTFNEKCCLLPTSLLTLIIRRVPTFYHHGPGKSVRPLKACTYHDHSDGNQCEIERTAGVSVRDFAKGSSPVTSGTATSDEDDSYSS